MIGLRYLRYQDSFVEDYRLDNGVGSIVTETASGEATNEAFGPQIGLGLDIRRRKYVDPLWWQTRLHEQSDPTIGSKLCDGDCD